MRERFYLLIGFSFLFSFSLWRNFTISFPKEKGGWGGVGGREEKGMKVKKQKRS
jgi:hypothetical protein